MFGTFRIPGQYVLLPFRSAPQNLQDPGGRGGGGGGVSSSACLGSLGSFGLPSPPIRTRSTPMIIKIDPDAKVPVGVADLIHEAGNERERVDEAVERTQFALHPDLCSGDVADQVSTGQTEKSSYQVRLPGQDGTPPL